MASCKYPVPFSLTFRSIKLKIHKLIHVPHHHHIAVQLHDSVVFLQRKWRELAPAVVKARVVGEIFMDGWKKVFDSLLGNFTNIKSMMTFRGECVGIEGNQRVFRAMAFERIIEGEEAGEIGCVCYKSSPYWISSAMTLWIL